MHVLFLMQTFINVNEAEAMYNSLVKEFVEHGHNVTVIASNEGREVTNLRKEGVADVLRVSTMPILNINLILKGISSLLLPIQYLMALKKYLKFRKFDLIITPTPPITLTNLAARLKKKDNAKILLILRDIFPQNAVDLEMLSKRNPFYLISRSLEKKLYRISDAIGCMSERNMEYLLMHNEGLTRDKLCYLPNWTTLSHTDSVCNNSLLDKYNLAGKFIVLFGGNLGAPQKVDNLVEFSKLHAEKKDLAILVIGKGTHKKHLEKLIEREGIENIIVLNYMKRSDYEHFISLSQVGFISLNEKFTIPNIPSRVLSYYIYKKPIFAIIDQATDFGEMLEADQSGFSCIYGEYDKYKELFNKLYYNPELRNKMGENGYYALLNKYNPQRTYSRITSALSIS